MDRFVYNDIFQTKGIEYLIIIAFLFLLIPFWIWVSRQKAFAEFIEKSVGIITAALLKAPKGIFYNSNHTWAFMQKSGFAEVGIDDWLLHIAGNVKFTKLKKPGEVVKKGELMTVMVNNKKELKIYAPVSGKVLSINPLACDNSESMSHDPYTEGWLYRVEPTNWKAETSQFYLGEEAKNWLKNELTRFKDFVAISLGENSPLATMVVLQEGGELRDHALNELPEAVWQDFQKEFLDS